MMGCQVLTGNPRNFTPPLLSHCVSGALTELRSALGFFFSGSSFLPSKKKNGFVISIAKVQRCETFVF